MGIVQGSSGLLDDGIQWKNGANSRTLAGMPTRGIGLANPVTLKSDG